MARTIKKSPVVDLKSIELGEEKLRSSGLTLDDAKILQISILNGHQVSLLHPSFKHLISLRFNYLDPDGEPISDWPCSKPFYRLRYLELGTDFASISEKKPTRYVQEPATAPVAYFPGNQDWIPITDNPDEPLILTEGELKAAKACKEGFPTIGLGGVYNWRSTKLGIEWLPSLELVTWTKRNVYICFDSDYRTNPMVCSALRSLAEELHRRGSFVHLVNLPQIEGFDKVGLDDYLTFAGPSANDMFADLLSNAEPLGLTKPLWALNDKYVYIQNPGLVIVQKSGYKISPSSFTQHLEAPMKYQERTVKSDGSISYKAVSAAMSWLHWPLRSEASKLTYQPGRGRFVGNGTLLYNVWPGWGIQPEEGDIKPFLMLIDHIFSGAEPEAKEWFLNWCAYPIQHPGVKLFTSAAIHGIKHGTGKSLIGYTLGRIYGQNFVEIDQGDLHNNFNEWAEAKQFVMGDDVTGSNKREDNDLLKKLITQRELRINQKFIPTYVVPDCINYFFTSNHPDSFFLEDDDRRFFIHEVIVSPLSEQFYLEYELWLDTGGSAAVFHYMQNKDTGQFNPAAPAPMTDAKDRMIAGVRSDLGAWARQLISAPDHTLKVGEMIINKDLFTSKELLAFYDPTGKTGTTANGLGRELARAGVRQILKGKPIRISDGSQGRYYAIRNQEHWDKATPAQIVKHLDDWSKKQTFKIAKY